MPVVIFGIAAIVAWYVPRFAAERIRRKHPLSAWIGAAIGIAAFIASAAVTVFIAAPSAAYFGSQQLAAMAALSCLLAPFAVWRGWKAGANAPAS